MPQNEKFIKDVHTLVSKYGFKGTEDEAYQLLQNNEDFQKDVLTGIKANGFKGELNDMLSIAGISLPEKKNSSDPTESILEDPSMATSEESGVGEENTDEELGFFDAYEKRAKGRSKSPSLYEGLGVAGLGQRIVDAAYNTVTNSLVAEGDATFPLQSKRNEINELRRDISDAQSKKQDFITQKIDLGMGQYRDQQIPLQDAQKRYIELEAGIEDNVERIKDKREESAKYQLPTNKTSDMFTPIGLADLVGSQIPRLGASLIPILGSYTQIYGDTYMTTLEAIAAKENGVERDQVTPQMMVKQIEEGKDGQANSFLSAAIGSSLDLIGLGKMANVLKTPLNGYVKQQIKKGLQKGGRAGAKKALSVGQDILSAGVVEGLTEGGQSAVQQIGTELAVDKTIGEAFNSLNWDQILKEGIAGAIIGGPIGGATASGIKFNSNDVEAMVAEYDVGALKQFTEEGLIDWNTIPERTRSKVKFLEKIKGEKVLPIPSAINRVPDVDVKEDVDIEEQVEQIEDEQTTTDTQGVPSMDEGAESTAQPIDQTIEPRAEESTDQQEEVAVSTEGLLSVDEGGKAELTTEDGRIIELGNIEDDKSLEELGITLKQPSVQPMGGSLYNVDGKELRLRDDEQFKFSKRGKTVTLYDDKNKPVKLIGNPAEEVEYFSSLNTQDQVNQNETTNKETKQERVNTPTTLKEAAESIYNTYSIIDSNNKTSISKESQNIVNEEVKEIKESKDITIEPEMAVDEKSRGKLYEFLDKKDKELTKFGKENLSFGLPVAVAQGTIKTMKLAIETAQTGADIIKAGVDYIKNTDWYKNQTKAKKAEIDTAFNDEKNFINLVGETPTKPSQVDGRVERLKDTSKRLRKQFSDLQEYKKNLIDNIYEKLKLKTLDNLSNYFNKPIFSQINNAKTPGAVDRLISKIDYKIASEELNKVDKAIKKFLNDRKGYIKKVSGKPKGNVVDNETRKLLTETINTKLSEDLNILEKQVTNIERSLGSLSEADFDKALIELTAIESAINLKKADALINNSKALRKEKSDNPKSYTAEEKADYKENVDLIAEGIRLKEQALNDLIALQEEGKYNLKEEVKKEAERLRALQDKALEDTNHALSDGETSTRDKNKEARGKFVNTFLKGLSTLKTFAFGNVTSSLEFLLKVVSNNSDIDKGFLRNYFFVEKTGFTEARQKAFQEKQANSDAIRDFIFKTFDVKGRFQEYKFLEWIAKARDQKAKTGIFIKDENGKLIERPMTKLNALAVYQWSKMDGVSSNLEQAGYTEESIEQVKKFLGDKYIALGDYMTDFLKAKFPEYNKQYRSIMRTDVTEVENYFPVNYNKEQLRNEVDIEGNQENYLASITPSHTINRVSNTNKLNDNADALDLFNNYLEVMTQFKHYSRPIKDINSVLSNVEFKKNLDRLSEDGNLYGKLIRAVGDIVGARVIESNKEAAEAGRLMYKMQQGIQLTYVGFKAYTAAKQLLSFFAVYEYAKSVRVNVKGKSYRVPLAGTALFTGKLIWDLPKAYKAYKFFYDKSVGFKDRVDSGDVGSESIRRALDGARTSKFNLAQKMAAKYGLFLNKAVDTFTIAWTGKTLYDQQMKMYKENGLTQKQANEKAIRDFEVYYTLSQQSSDPELLSSSQRDKGFIGLFSAFKNAQQSYFRKIAGSFTSLVNSYKNEKVKLEKLGKVNAGEKAILKILSTDSDQNNIKKIMLYGYVMPLAWQYVASGLPGMLTKWDDDDEYEMKRTLLLGPLDGAFIVGDFLKFAADKVINGVRWSYSPIILEEEIRNLFNDSSKAFNNGVLSAEMAYLAAKYTLKLTGLVDLDSSVKIYEALEDIIDEKKTPSYENVMKVLNAPKALTE